MPSRRLDRDDHAEVTLTDELCRVEWSSAAHGGERLGGWFNNGYRPDPPAKQRGLATGISSAIAGSRN